MIPDLQGGAEAFGLTTLSPAVFGNLFANAPAGTGAALYRVHLGPGIYSNDFSGYDSSLLVNLSGCSPGRSAARRGADSLHTLLQEGYLNNPEFGGSGTEVLTSLAANGVYMTLVPSSTTTFNALFDFNGSLHARLRRYPHQRVGHLSV